MFVASVLGVTILAAFMIGLVAYWTYGWENVIGELICVGIVLCSALLSAFFKVDGHNFNGIRTLFAGFVAVVSSAVVCAFFEPGTATEIALIALLTLLTPITAMLEKHKSGGFM